MPYPEDLTKELRKHWAKTLRKGGTFALSLNGFPGDKQRQPLLRVHPTKPMTKDLLKRMSPDGAYFAKMITGRIDPADGEVKFWIAPDSKVKSPALLRKAIKRLAEEDDLTNLQPKIAKLKRAPMAMEETVDMDQATDIVDTSDSRKKGKKSWFKKVTGWGLYSKLLGELDKWNAKFQRGVSASSLDKALTALNDIDVKALDWKNKNRDTDKTERLAQVEDIRQRVARARNKLTALRSTLGESQEADTLLTRMEEDSYILTEDEERRVAANLRARIAATKDPDEKEQLREMLGSLPSECARKAKEAQQSVDQLRPDEDGGDVYKALTETQRSSLRILEVYLASGSDKELTDPRGGDKRLQGKEAIIEALVEQVEALMRASPKASGTYGETLTAYEEVFEAIAQHAPEHLEALEKRFEKIAAEETRAWEFGKKDKTSFLHERVTWCRGNDAPTRTRNVVMGRHCEGLRDQLTSIGRVGLGEFFMTVPKPEHRQDPQNESNTLPYYDEAFIQKVVETVEQVLEAVAPENLPVKALRQIAITHRELASHPAGARLAIVDLLILRQINPTLRVPNDPETGKPYPKTPQGMGLVTKTLQNIFNEAFKGDVPQMVPCIKRNIKNMPTFWRDLLTRAYEVAGFEEGPVLDAALCMQLGKPVTKQAYWRDVMHDQLQYAHVEWRRGKYKDQDPYPAWDVLLPELVRRFKTHDLPSDTIGDGGEADALKDALCKVLDRLIETNGRDGDPSVIDVETSKSMVTSIREELPSRWPDGPTNHDDLFEHFVDPAVVALDKGLRAERDFALVEPMDEDSLYIWVRDNFGSELPDGVEDNPLESEQVTTLLTDVASALRLWFKAEAGAIRSRTAEAERAHWKNTFKGALQKAYKVVLESYDDIEVTDLKGLIKHCRGLHQERLFPLGTTRADSEASEQLLSLCQQWIGEQLAEARVRRNPYATKKVVSPPQDRPPEKIELGNELSTAIQEVTFLDPFSELTTFQYDRWHKENDMATVSELVAFGRRFREVIDEWEETRESLRTWDWQILDAKTAFNRFSVSRVGELKDHFTTGADLLAGWKKFVDDNGVGVDRENYAQVVETERELREAVVALDNAVKTLRARVTR